MGQMPEILSHPSIPKPMHGMNPRALMGRIWWDDVRRKVYDKYGQTCAACGVHKSEALKHKWLEAHENFHIDYREKTCRILSIEPLCHYCHSFIHSGLLLVKFNRGDVTRGEFVSILDHGCSILRESKSTIFPVTAFLCDGAGVSRTGIMVSKVPKHSEWGGWRLLWGKMEWPAKYQNKRQWEKAMSR